MSAATNLIAEFMGCLQRSESDSWRPPLSRCIPPHGFAEQCRAHLQRALLGHEVDVYHGLATFASVDRVGKPTTQTTDLRCHDGKYERRVVSVEKPDRWQQIRRPGYPLKACQHRKTDGVAS